jgi:hypothetical protein
MFPPCASEYSKNVIFQEVTGDIREVSQYCMAKGGQQEHM